MSATSNVDDEAQEAANGYENVITASPNSTTAVTGRRRTSDNIVTSNRHHSEGLDALNVQSTSSSNVSASQDTPKRSSASYKSMTGPNFSIPLAGSPSGRKHRPSPLNLGADNKETQKQADAMADAKIKMTLKERVKSTGRNSPRSPKVM